MTECEQTWGVKTKEEGNLANGFSTQMNRKKMEKNDSFEDSLRH